MSKRKKGLGDLFQPRTGLLKHREWKGVCDTLYDFYRWQINWKDLILFIAKAPVTTFKAVFRYRWMSTYLCTHAFIDRNTLGLRGAQLRINHLHFNGVVKHLTGVINTSLTVDPKKVVLFDETVPPQISLGFPNLVCLPSQAAPVYVPSLVSQLATPHYIDAAEYYGVPADVCPLPQAEAGCAIEDDYPVSGTCFITVNMPCDGSVMTTSYQDRRFNIPSYTLSIPLRYKEEGMEEFTVEEIKGCIEFIEKHTGETFDWDSFQAGCAEFNKQTEKELAKWDMNKTKYPQVVGGALWTYRIYYFQLGVANPIFRGIDEKVSKLITKAHKKKNLTSKNPKYRAIYWNTPCNYYQHFASWMELAWGIVDVCEMIAQTSSLPIEVGSKEETLLGVAKTYQRASMRAQTKGGYANCLDELWLKCDEYNVDMVVMYDQVACKGMDGLKAIFDEQARERNIKMIWVSHDLLDHRTISRQAMRDQVNKYMLNVMQETPLDESLLEFDDSHAW